ncbi:MAG TPA: hypothetical protein VK589_04345 [Chryseolinea sp.]|nr:hypothetical protein [Chryseolinea sp.]
MSKFNFHKIAGRMKAELQVVLDKMANNAVNHFKVDNFNAEAFIDEAPKRWARRKQPDPGRRLLVKTGRGRQSIKVLSRNGNTRKVGTLVPYMALHNTGTRTLPKRQMIGKSRRLERINHRLVLRFLKKYS